MGRTVAVKLLNRHPDMARDILERFRREGRAAGRLNHPFVVAVHDFCIPDAGDPYLVMELCAGGSLSDELRRTGRATFRRTSEVIESVASAVSAAHRAGIVHRDLKPANILIAQDRVKVADFGLATLSEDDPAPGLTGGFAVGSPHYMSPEQAEGRTADARSDLYSLGVIAYEMLTGSVPFEGASVGAVLMKHLTQIPESPSNRDPSVPERASAVILRALAKDADRRYASVHEFAEALSRALRPAGSSKESWDPRVSTKPVTAVESERPEGAGTLGFGSGPPSGDTLVQETGPSPQPGASGISTRVGEPVRTSRWKALADPIGREGHLLTLNARLLAALRGQGGFAFVSGEPGAGKTTLVQAFLGRELASRSELVTATGRCSEHFGVGQAYLPLIEIVGRLASGLEEGRGAGLLRSFAPAWIPHLPASARGNTGPLRDEAVSLIAEERMPRELVDFLSALTRTRPLILVLEDLHWVDRSTADFLPYLARRIGEMRLLVVGTYRPAELQVGKHPFRVPLQEFLVNPAVAIEVVPTPFTTAEVDRFLTRELGSSVDPEVVRFVERRTEGNPLFVANLLRHLTTAGALRVEGGQATATRPFAELATDVPEGVMGVILSRFDRLEEEDQRLLHVAAVQGETFDSAALAAILGRNELDIEDRLASLERVHRLVEATGEIGLADGNVTAGFRFLHAFYQNALYGRVLPRRRAAWHRALAELLAARHANCPEEIAATLAVHYERARENARCIQALEEAAAGVSKRNPREAGPLLLRAVDVAGRLPDESRPEERARLLTRVGRHYAETAELIGDRTLYEKAREALEEALAIEPEGPHAADARTTLGLLQLEQGDNEGAFAALSAVVATTPEHARAHAALAYLFKNTGLWDRCLREQRIAGRLDPRYRHSIPRLSIFIYQGRYIDALAESDALLQERPKYSHYNYWRGIVHYYRGDLTAARDWIERGYTLDPDNLIAKGVRAFLFAVDGEAESARPLLREVEPGAAADGTFTYWIAKIHAALGELDLAIEWLGRAERLGYWNAPWMRTDWALRTLRPLKSFQSLLETVSSRQDRFSALIDRLETSSDSNRQDL